MLRGHLLCPEAMSPRTNSHAIRRRWQLGLAICLLCAAALWAYHNSFGGPFVFDDTESIASNASIHGFWSALRPPAEGLTVTARPVLNLSFAANYAAAGANVSGYHVVNLVIHITSARLLFGILRRTIDARRDAIRESATPIAFTVALLWVVHPLQTESVTYIVQRAESLMGLFYLLTLYAFIRGTETKENAGKKGFSLRVVWLGISWCACLSGMGTKEVMVSAPVIVFLYDRVFVAGSFKDAWVRRTGYYLSLAATWVLLAWLVSNAGFNRGGSSGQGADFSKWAYGLTQMKAIVRYLGLVFWPQPLVFDYGAQWVSSAVAAAPYMAVVVVLIIGTLVSLWRWPVVGFLGFFFFSILAPSSLIPGNRQTMAEHRMYLALAPVLLLVVLSFNRLFGRKGLILFVGAALVCGYLTLSRNEIYRSELNLWADTVNHSADNADAQVNLGTALVHAGRGTEAIDHYEEAIRRSRTILRRSTISELLRPRQETLSLAKAICAKRLRRVLTTPKRPTA